MLYASTASCSHTSFDRKRWHNTRIQCVACLPSMIHCSAFERRVPYAALAFGSSAEKVPLRASYIEGLEILVSERAVSRTSGAHWMSSRTRPSGENT